MWVRSEFGVLCNLVQATEITVSTGTVEARFGREVCPLAHRAGESEAWKVFDRVAQELAAGTKFLDLSQREAASPSHTEASPLQSDESESKPKAL